MIGAAVHSQIFSAGVAAPAKRCLLSITYRSGGTGGDELAFEGAASKGAYQHLSDAFVWPLVFATALLLLLFLQLLLLWQLPLLPAAASVAASALGKGGDGEKRSISTSVTRF